jgi:hypothetical protein
VPFLMRSRALSPLVLTILIGLPPLSSVADAQRAIPDDNLAYPVLITLRNGSTGSGFYLNNGKAIYLVTAKHVLFNEANHQLIDLGLDLLSYSKDPTESAHNLITLDLSVLQGAGNIIQHPLEDAVVVKVFTTTIPAGAPTGSFSLSPVPGVTVKGMSKAGLLGVGLATIKTFEQVLIGNDVMVFGYPTSLRLQQLPKLDIHRPLLRKGIVAGMNPDQHSIIIDCPSYFGNSGGPVVEFDRDGFQTHLNVIGVISQYVPFVDTGGSKTFSMQVVSNSGYSIITPMNFVLELVK